MLEDVALTTEIMETKEPEKLLLLQQKMKPPVQQWFDSVWRILHESNSAKVCELQPCNNVASNFLFLFVKCLVMIVMAVPKCCK